jgi:hypothetical protein
MAVYKIFAEKDTTLYSLFPFMNTGVDEIVEATTTTFFRDFLPQVSRTLIKFENEDINNAIDNVIGGLQYVSESNLKLSIATAEGLSENTAIETYPISGTWNMGTGKYLDDPVTTNGASWQWMNFSGSRDEGEKRWPLIPQNSNYVTTSMDPLGAGGGGTWWYKDPQNENILGTSQFYTYKSNKDLKLNVTDVIKIWYSSSNAISNPSKDQILNEGFIVKQTGNNEFINHIDKATELKYFSCDTNTIYPPELEFKWVDVSFDTGSSTNTIINNRNLVASLLDNPGKFREEDIYDFRFVCRPKFPERVFQTGSLYTTHNYLPSESYYAIKDLDTNEFIIDFDTQYTQISADEESNYFRIYMDGLQPERYYKILIKTIIGRDTIILDDNYYFKVING